MAIYSPPKQTMTSTIASSTGDVLMSGAGLLAATGVGTPIALAVGAAGAIAKGVGAIAGANDARKLQEYNQKYNAIVSGENNIKANAYNNEIYSRDNYTQNSVNTSLKRINMMLEPTANTVPSSGGTGIVNNRLI